MYGKVVLSVLALVLFSYGGVNGQAQLTLSVYYESLCPDSIRFITTQLYKNYLLLGGYGNQYLELDFVPYGKANTTLHPNGTHTFVCQHGPRECEGNKVQACALKRLPKHRTAEFIYCAMNSTAPPESGPDCAQKLGLDYQPIQDCLTTDGPALLADLGNRTHSLDPTLYYVPWIIYNNVFSESDLWASQEDFLGLVCLKFWEFGNGLPPACSL